jgi:signal-transduction protein with cAMP-binding, CBS, and nucleotidyltransferase domain
LLSKEKIGAVSKDDLLIDRLSDLDGSAADCLIALDDKNRPEGIITKRDIAKFISKGIDLNQKISALMTSPVTTADKHCSINGAFYLMQDRNLKRIIVIEDDGSLIGAATQREILDAIYSKLAQKGFFKIERLNQFIGEHVEKKTAELERANKSLTEKLTELERKFQAARINSLLRS